MPYTKKSKDRDNGYKMLAAAIIATAIDDCKTCHDLDNLREPYDSHRFINLGGQYIRASKLQTFFESDWLDLLLCWQTDISPSAVCDIARPIIEEYLR